MVSKLKIDDLPQNEKLDREAMTRISGGGRTGTRTAEGARLKRRFHDTAGKGWATRFRVTSR